MMELAEQLFTEEPIQFIPRKNEKLELELKKMIDNLKITIPIIWIKGTLYLIGDKKVNLQKKGEFITAKAGGGFEPFDTFIRKNRKTYERNLLVKMIQSKESLEWVVESIIAGSKIPTVMNAFRPSSVQ